MRFNWLCRYKNLKQCVANGEHSNVSLYYYLNNCIDFQRKACFTTLCSLFPLPVLPFPTFTHHFTTMWRTQGLGLQDLALVSPALQRVLWWPSLQEILPLAHLLPYDQFSCTTHLTVLQFLIIIPAQNYEPSEDGDNVLIIFNPNTLAHYWHKLGAH